MTRGRVILKHMMRTREPGASGNGDVNGGSNVSSTFPSAQGLATSTACPGLQCSIRLVYTPNTASLSPGVD